MSIIHEWLKARTVRAEARAKERVIRAWCRAVLEIDERAEKLATGWRHREGWGSYSSMSYEVQRLEFARLLAAIMPVRPATLTETEAMDVAERAIEELGRIKP